MTNYFNGARFEREVKKELEKEFPLVIRSAGSKGKIDLAAFMNGKQILYQCKKTNVLSKIDEYELIQLGKELNLPIWIAYKEKTIKYRRLV